MAKTTADFYFQQGNDPNMGIDFFLITPKAFFDKHGHLSDASGVVPHKLLPSGFEELSESTYEFNGDATAGRQALLTAGFVEHKLA